LKSVGGLSRNWAAQLASTELQSDDFHLKQLAKGVVV
jgi:hypothetical protein